MPMLISSQAFDAGNQRLKNGNDFSSNRRTNALFVQGQRVFFGNHGCGIDRRTNQDEQKRRVNIVKAQP